ncbi:hypothetical protein HYW17_00635 [Candidatus Uhrbacteria bacterium]|nr:hypothetical protein [Candidatus Uhrbacteria bacterium]
MEKLTCQAALAALLFTASCRSGSPPGEGEDGVDGEAEARAEAESDGDAIRTGFQGVVCNGVACDSAFFSDEWYDPATNSWTATSAGRWITAIWTGSEMIVWSGSGDDVSVLNTGARYRP